MSSLTTQTINMVRMLPDDELMTVNSLLKMLIRSWDPDYVKVTPSEKRKLERIEDEISKGEFYSDDEVWK